MVWVVVVIIVLFFLLRRKKPTGRHEKSAQQSTVIAVPNRPETRREEPAQLESVVPRPEIPTPRAKEPQRAKSTGYTDFKIPPGDPHSVKDLLELSAGSMHLFLLSLDIHKTFSANGLSLETEPRACLALVVHALITEETYIDKIEKLNEHAVANIIWRYKQTYDTQGSAATQGLIKKLQAYVGAHDSILGNALLAALFATIKDDYTARSLSAKHLDQVVPLGFDGLNACFDPDVIGVLLSAAMWLCDYLGFRAVYRKMCYEDGFDALSRATYFDKGEYPASELSAFLDKYADYILNSDSETLREDQENAEKFIRGYQQFETSHDVSEQMRLAFLVLCLYAAPDLIYKSSGLVTAEYMIAQMDQYLESLPPEAAKAFIDALYKNQDAHAATTLSETLGTILLCPPVFDLNWPNWPKISKHIDALVEREHPPE